jgi:[CysO sulfur-carrier protein]-S-L-cysteine hydrolase
VRIARSLLDQIVAQAREEAPNECCGIVASRDGQAVTLYKLRNAAASPLRYEIDSHDLFRASESIEDAGLEIGIIYHSHTRTAPEPSETDINLANYPDAIYLIVGVMDPERDDIRAWHIRDGRYAEAPLEVDEG